MPTFVPSITRDRWVNLDLVAVLRPFRKGGVVDHYHCLNVDGVELGVVGAVVIDHALTLPTVAPQLVETPEIPDGPT